MPGEETMRKLKEAMNRHDATAMAQHYAPDCTVIDPFVPQPLKGREAVRQDYADFVKGFPDLRIQVINILSKGDTVSGEFTMTGTHRGPLTSPTGEIPPTNKRIEMKGASFARVNQQGQIIEERRYYDSATMLQQLGLMPQPQMAGAGRQTSGPEVGGGQRR